MAEGVVDIVWTVEGNIPGLFPQIEIFKFTPIFPMSIAVPTCACGSGDPDGAKAGLQLANTKGLKLRVPGPTKNAVVEAMGATAVTMTVPDLPQALGTRGVDRVLIS